jgi:hypothetical protein
MAPVRTQAKLHPLERRGSEGVLQLRAREEETLADPRAPGAAEQAALEFGVPVVLDIVVRPPRQLRGDC